MYRHQVRALHTVRALRPHDILHNNRSQGRNKGVAVDDAIIQERRWSSRRIARRTTTMGVFGERVQRRVESRVLCVCVYCTYSRSNDVPPQPRSGGKGQKLLRPSVIRVFRARTSVRRLARIRPSTELSRTTNDLLLRYISL